MPYSPTPSEASSSEYNANKNKKRRSFDKLERCYSFSKYQWSSRYHYLLFTVLMSNGNDVTLHMLKLQVELSGGVFVILLLFISFLFTMPLIYIEIFYGKYTKLTNCQIYRMATIFFGVSLSIFLINIAYQIIVTPEDAKILVNAVKIFIKHNKMKRCFDEDKACYDYIVNGPINDTCKPVFMGMQCEGKGFVRFPKQHLHWKMYLDTDDIYPYSQIIVGLALSWVLILYIAMKELDALGWIISYAFIFQLIVMTIVFILSLLYSRSAESLKALLEINPSFVTSHNVINAIWYIIGHFGFITPCGYMSVYAFANFTTNFGLECFAITLFNILLTFYYYIIYFTAAGITAANMAVAVENIIVPEGGLFLIVIPEFLDYVQIPDTFLFVYYSSIWVTGTIKNAVCLHIILLNWYDYFPKTKFFSSYITAIACTICCLLSILTCSKEFNKLVMPLMISTTARILVEIVVTLMSFMVCYVYGVSRMCEDIEFVTGRKPVKYWAVMWYIIPIFGWLNVIFSKKDVLHFANNSQIISSFLNGDTKYITLTYVLFVTTAVVSTFLKIISHMSTPHLFCKLVKPQFYWGPPERKLRIERKQYDTSKRIRSEDTSIEKIKIVDTILSDSKLIDKLIEECFEDCIN